MFKQLAASIALISLSLSTFAEVIVKAPEEIIVVAINDQEIRNSLFSGKDKVYKLDDGQHKISVQYKQLFNPLYTTHEVVRSGIVTLSTGQLSNGQYELVLINPPQDVDQGKAFAEQPVIGLRNAQGQVVAQQAGANSKAKSWFGSGFLGSVLDLREDKEDTSVASGAPIAALPATPQPATTVAISTNTATVSASGRDQQLIELWKNATPQERQRFTAWLAEQASK